MNDQIGNHRAEFESPVRALRLVEMIPPRFHATTPFGKWPQRFWIGIVTVAFCTFCLSGFVRARNNAKLSRNNSLATAQTTDVSNQLHSLRQTDLIQFSDGRIWYVRNVQGDNLEVVGWIGDNAKIQDIPSFVFSGERFRIVRKTDPAWALTRDKYFMQ